MQLKVFRLRFRRRLRKSQRQVEDLGSQAEIGLERHLFRRLGSLRQSWRFVAGWVGLMVIILVYQVAQIEGLANHYQTMQPVPGGTYTEGVLGNFTNANPLFAVSEADSSVSKLLFGSLFTYDNHNRLVGDLASGYSLNAKGTVYTVHLRPGLTWQDGQPLTADDVVFTYRTIQNPDVQSPLASSWQHVQVSKVDARTVAFTLSNPLASFPYTMTNGIVPQHLLGSITPTDLRSADFNTVRPVGAGPFEWSALQVKNPDPANKQVFIALKPFEDYHAGSPKLAGMVMGIFNDSKDLINAFKHQQLNGIAGLDSVPQPLAADKQLQQTNLILTAADMAFFNTASTVLSDAKVRHALVQASNTAAIIRQLGYPTKRVNEPLLVGQLGYNKLYAQAPYDPQAAAAALTDDGWKENVPGGLRSKQGTPLSFTLYASDTAEHRLVAGMLKRQWRQVGVDCQTVFQSDDDLSSTVATHSYDALLYGISIGVDPDVYVYWDSSQTDPRSTRLNFSMYKSGTADTALEAGRTRQDPVLRAVKYKSFLQAWQQDAPAVGLYQPRFLYLTNEKVYGLDAVSINTDTDRFNNVVNWEVRTAKVTTH